jgi:hypothetical protein
MRFAFVRDGPPQSCRYLRIPGTRGRDLALSLDSASGVFGMNYGYKGMMAGLAGALVLAGFFMLNGETGLVPGLDFIAMLGDVTGTGRIGGWMFHLAIAAVWGSLFAWLDPDLPGDSLRQRGIIFAVVPWLLMMLLLMPLAGHGFFGMDDGVLLPFGALLMHVVFGAVMGGTYGWLILQAVPLRYRRFDERHARNVAPARTQAESDPIIAGPPTVPSEPEPALAASDAGNVTPIKRAKPARQSVDKISPTIAQGGR